jgi:hypothetical protein
MDDDTKNTFDEINRRLSSIDKRFDDTDKRFDDTGRRFDDVKWHITLISSVFTLIFTVLTLLAGWNYSSERTGLENVKKELKEEIGKSDDSKIELYGLDKIDLVGQEISANLSEELCKNTDKDCGGRSWLAYFDIIVRNASNAQSGKMYFKVYTTKPLNGLCTTVRCLYMLLMFARRPCGSARGMERGAVRVPMARSVLNAAWRVRRRLKRNTNSSR